MSRKNVYCNKNDEYFAGFVLEGFNSLGPSSEPLCVADLAEVLKHTLVSV